MQIQQTADNTFKMTNRGTDYTLIADRDGRFSLWSTRRALGNVNVRVFNTLAELERTIKAFRGISQVIGA